MSKFRIEYYSDNRILFNGEIIDQWQHSDSCRLIFKTKDYVIKCDNWVSYKREFNSIYKQCEKEYKNYLKIFETDNQYKKYFVPIIDFGELFDGYYYVVQPKIEILMDEKDNYFDIVYDIGNKFKLEDIHSGNYSVTKNNDILIFDYSF